MKKLQIVCLLCIFTMFLAQVAYAKNTIELNMALAASLRPVFEEKIIPLFKEENKNIDIKGIYDSSARLEVQIKEGLNVDFFFSAAPLHIQRLVEARFIEKDNTKEILTNKLVLIQNTQNAKNTQLKDIKKISSVEIIALGNPRSTPIGSYTKEALEELNLWQTVGNMKLSLAQNVTEILSWVSAGSAEAGIVYASDAKTAKNIVIVAEIPFNNEDIRYVAAPLKSSKNTKELDIFMSFLLSDKIQKIFIEYGFMGL